MSVLTVLGVEVDEERLRRWTTYYAPGRQPFRLRGLDAPVRHALEDASLPGGVEQVSPEHRDTFFLYGGGPWVWLSEDELAGLDGAVRTALLAERRERVRPKPVPAWPSDPLLVPAMVRWVETGSRPSLHLLARDELAAASHGPLPGAATLAGTYAEGSGPNCFAAVMAAAGEPVAQEWVQLDQFRTWLEASTDPLPQAAPPVAETDRRPGCVLVWHEDGELAHAAVTIGGGWALHKQSQSWSSPFAVWPVEEVVRSWLVTGTRLSRHLLRPRPTPS